MAMQRLRSSGLSAGNMEIFRNLGLLGLHWLDFQAAYSKKICPLVTGPVLLPLSIICMAMFIDINPTLSSNHGRD